MSCWSCHADPGRGTFCTACGKLQPLLAEDFFAVIGLPRRFHLAVADVEKRQRELSRQLHPDRFARADAHERRLSLEHTTRLNDAVKTLKDPIRRAEYLLRAEGFTPVTDASGKPGAGHVLPMAFYEEVLEDREALEEAKAKSTDQVQALGKKIEGRQAASLSAVDAAFAAWETTGAKDALKPAVVELAKVRYYARFLDEVAGKPHD